jgi:ribosomal protein S6
VVESLVIESSTMPLYQQIILCLPGYGKTGLVDLFRKHARIVQKTGGIVRAIENNGVRPLPERARRAFPTREGERYFWEARYVSTYFDASPKALVELGRMLRTEEGILRFFTLKKDSVKDRVSAANYKNPFKPKAESTIEELD